MDDRNQTNSPDCNPRAANEAFELLALRYLDGLHTEDEARQLNEQLASCAERRELFAALSVEMGMLKEMLLASPRDDSLRGAPPHQQTRRLAAPLVFGELDSSDSVTCSGWLRSYWPVQWLLIAVLLAGGLVGWLPRSGLNDQPPASVEVGGRSAPVAFLTVANGCDWGGNSPDIWTVGRGVQLGDEIALHEGIAEFRLASGVSLSIEGPAALIILSPTSLVLQHGRLTAHVPWTVADFKVVSGTCRLSACDAEFGIDVAGGDLDIHVFSGQVLAASTPFEKIPAINWDGEELLPKLVQRETDLPPGARVIQAAVGQGRGLSLASVGGVINVAGWHAADEAQFATKLRMAGPLPVTRAYVEAVRESKPVAYWRFDQRQDNIIRSEVPEGPELSVFGDLRLSGDLNNRVAEFRSAGSTECFLLSSRPLDALAGKDSYSIEVWVKPSHVHWAGLVALLSEPTTEHEGHAFYLELQGAADDVFRPFPWKRPPGTMRFLHRDPPSENLHSGTACYSESPYDIRRWQHVAAVKEGSRMRLYLNGCLADAREDESSLASDLYVLIGRCRTPQRANMVGKRMVSFPFVGQLDELAVYDRALSEREITEHYRTIRQVLDRNEGRDEHKTNRQAPNQDKHGGDGSQAV